MRAGGEAESGGRERDQPEGAGPRRRSFGHVSPGPGALSAFSPIARALAFGRMDRRGFRQVKRMLRGAEFREAIEALGKLWSRSRQGRLGVGHAAANGMLTLIVRPFAGATHGPGGFDRAQQATLHVASDWAPFAAGAGLPWRRRRSDAGASAPRVARILGRACTVRIP